MLLSEASVVYLEQRRIEGCSPHTIDSYRYLLGKIRDVIGDKPVSEITLQDLRAYLATVTNRKSATLAMRIRLLRVFCRWLAEEGHSRDNAARKLKEPKQPDSLPKALNMDDLEGVREACQTTREHALIEMLFATGCRAGEVSGMTRQAVDWQLRSLVVLGKGSKEREVYFGARARRWLQRYLNSRADDSEYLFVTERGTPRQLTPHQIWYIVKGVARRAGMAERVWPHVFRHTLGTSLLNRGAKLDAVQSILGHTDPKTTQRYARLSGQNRRIEFEKFFIQ